MAVSLKEITQIKPIINPLFFVPIQSTGNSIGDTGATSLSDALKSNAALTQLDLRSEDKRNNMQMISMKLFLAFSFNQQTTTLETQEQHH